MNNPKDALESIKAGCNDDQKGFYEFRFKELEKAIDVLDLIKLAPQQLIDIKKSTDYYAYISIICSTLSLIYSKEQYEKIKEWLGNDN